MNTSIAARIGTIEIMAVTDGDSPLIEPTWLFPDVPEEAWADHAYALDHERRHVSNFGSFVLRIGEELILIDAGLGPIAPERFGKPPAGLPGSLAGIGLNPTDITTIVLTHLHYDHVGWLLTVDGKSPMFPNARHVVSRTDWDHWRHPANPDGELEVAPGVRTLPTPGHTPGHQSLLLESSGERGVITGDVFHSAAQFAEPDWSYRADIDPVRARATRVKLLERLLPGMVVASGHLPHGSNIGTIALLEGRKYWQGFDSPS